MGGLDSLGLSDSTESGSPEVLMQGPCGSWKRPI
jgi:hypothetical protein